LAEAWCPLINAFIIKPVHFGGNSQRVRAKAIATSRKFRRCGQWALGTGIVLAPISLTIAQEPVIRSLCSPIAKAEIAKLEIAKPEITKSEITNSETAKQQSAKPEIAKSEIAEIAIAKIDRCIRPSSFRIRCNPEITKKISREYEDSLLSAKGVSDEAMLSHVRAPRKIASRCGSRAALA
jgi:hypothetical protein